MRDLWVVCEFPVCVSVAETTFSTTTGRIDGPGCWGRQWCVNSCAIVAARRGPRRSTLSTAFLSILGSGRCFQDIDCLSNDVISFLSRTIQNSFSKYRASQNVTRVQTSTSASIPSVRWQPGKHYLLLCLFLLSEWWTEIAVGRTCPFLLIKSSICFTLDSRRWTKCLRVAGATI